MKKSELGFSEIVEGTFELCPVRLTETRGTKEEFPLVCSVLDGLDHLQLHEDFKNCVAQLTDRYIYERKDYLGCDLETAKRELNHYNFSSDFYSAYGLMKLGTTELLDCVPSYTRKVLSALPDKVCRAHYAVARNGWKSGFHYDCQHFQVQGFRLNIPINQSAFYSFQQGDSVQEFELSQGSAWFINAAIDHRGLNLHPESRIAIICQLMGDSALLLSMKGQTIKMI